MKKSHDEITKVGDTVTIIDLDGTPRTGVLTKLLLGEGRQVMPGEKNYITPRPFRQELFTDSPRGTGLPDPQYKPPLHAFNREAPQPPKAPERPPVVHIREGEQATELSGLTKGLLFFAFWTVSVLLASLSGAAAMDKHRQDQRAQCELKYSTPCGIAAIPLERAP